ncbi:DUF5085 family protein [Fictibacillus fluitans]|uniref:DUF5085 family protein n=1 Tax=Fictibacillus fluitans TaxID=3058422 RepID=A0ABT8HYR0_9BACL|nr:DUF5085 family protein [Fictibacillus sp. NE201]MDN4525897.1 DUF5085 family protein [Fictibacillus sp. NE201]
MKVQYKSLSMLNLVSITQVVKREDWLLPATSLRSQVVNNGIYPVGPVLFKFKPLENDPGSGEFTYSVPVNDRVELEKGSAYEYIDVLVIEEALCVRFTDEDGGIEEAYQLIQETAKQNQISLDPSFYHVCLDVFGETWLDVYAPIVEVGESVR